MSTFRKGRPLTRQDKSSIYLASAIALIVLADFVAITRLYENVAFLLTLSVFLTIAGIYAVVSRAPGPTDEERHAKNPMKTGYEKKTPKVSATNEKEGRSLYLCICMSLLLVVVSPFLPGGMSSAMGPFAFVPFIIILLIVGAFAGASRVGEAEKGTYDSYPQYDSKTVRRPIASSTSSKRKGGASEGPESGMSLARTSGGQLFWRTGEAIKSQQDEVDSRVRALRGGEIVGGRFRFKVKVQNQSAYTINDVTVYILAYPRDTLILKSDDDDVFFSKIEPNGFRSPSFDFLPTQDCVRGEIVAGVSYVDASGKAHTLTTESYTIRAVCDLLQPEAITPQRFEQKLKQLESGEILLKVEEWSPQEMYDKTLRVLIDSNFHEVSSNKTETEGVLHLEVSG